MPLREWLVARQIEVHDKFSYWYINKSGWQHSATERLLNVERCSPLSALLGDTQYFPPRVYAIKYLRPYPVSVGSIPRKRRYIDVNSIGFCPLFVFPTSLLCYFFFNSV